MEARTQSMMFLTDYDGTIEIKLRGQTSLFLFDKKSYNLETTNAEWKRFFCKFIGLAKRKRLGNARSI